MRKMLSLRKLLVSVIVAAMTMAIIPFARVDATVGIDVSLNISTLTTNGYAMVPGTSGGTAVVNKSFVYPGETVTVVYTPNSGFGLDLISFGNGNTNVQEGLSTSFTVPIDYYEDTLVIDVVFKASDSIDTVPLEFYGYYGNKVYTVYAVNYKMIALPDYASYWYTPAGMHFEGWKYSDGAVGNEYFSKYRMDNGSLYPVCGAGKFYPVFKYRFTGWTDTGDGGVDPDSIGDASLGGLGSANPYIAQYPGETVYFEFALKDGYVLDNDDTVEIIGADGQTVLKTLSMSKYPNSNYYSVSFTMPDQDISFKFKTKSLYKTVTFNSNGGSSVPAQTVDNGYKATKPADPTKSGYTFGGWYTDSACTTAYDFNSAVTADLTLYAKWTAVASAPEPMATPKLTTGIAHVQDIGDVSYTTEAGVLTIGTRGMGKRLEEITINFENTTGLSGTLEYRVHVQDYGWMEWVPAGTKCGTEGEAKRIEAIEIRFTGELAEYYSVEYCVHIQDYGDMQGWVKDGALAGTTGESKRIEELKIRIVPKNSGSSMSVKYRVHVQDYGWEGAYASNGQMSGTSGESKRLEGIELFLSGTQYSGSIKYKTHVQDYGWQGWSYDGEMSGTQGQSKRLEGICIELYGEIAEYYDIYYRVHAQDIGWMAWAKNGECAGTAGRSARLEGIQIVLVPKGSPAPGATYEGITAVTDKAFVEGF